MSEEMNQAYNNINPAFNMGIDQDDTAGAQPIQPIRPRRASAYRPQVSQPTGGQMPSRGDPMRRSGVGNEYGMMHNQGYYEGGSGRDFGGGHAPPQPYPTNDYAHSGYHAGEGSAEFMQGYGDSQEYGAPPPPVQARASFTNPYNQGGSNDFAAPKELRPPVQPYNTGMAPSNPANSIAHVQALTKTKSAVLVKDQIMDLQDDGFPAGLSEELGKARALYPVRFWVVDNSGSMMTNDGQSVRGKISYQCTRWAELQETVGYHAKMAHTLQATTYFRLLNDPGVRVGPQEFSVADKVQDALTEVDQANSIMRKCQPHGSTPLTQHLIEIGKQISVTAPRMRSKGLEAVVVLATDGLPTGPDGETNGAINDEFIQTLQYLQSLPVWIVVRLCTDEKSVVKFYNELDGILELPLEVLDDFFNEAKEINKLNKWLNYAMPLHRCREMGYHSRLFDLLDERSLNKDEVKEFCTLLFGESTFMKAPDVHSDWKGFCNFLATVLKDEKEQFNPVTKKMGPWIDIKKLKSSFGGGGLGGLFGKKKK